MKRPDGRNIFLVLGHDERGIFATRVAFRSLEDALVEKKLLGFDFWRSPNIVTYKKYVNRDDAIILQIRNKDIPMDGSLVSTNFIVEHAKRNFFDKTWSLSKFPFWPT